MSFKPTHVRCIASDHSKKVRVSFDLFFEAIIIAAAIYFGLSNVQLKVEVNVDGKNVAESSQRVEG